MPNTQFCLLRLAPPCKLHALVNMIANRHEISVAVDAAAAAAVDAPAATNRLVIGNGGVHRPSWSKDR